jgi:hypothetical protein
MLLLKSTNNEHKTEMYGSEEAYNSWRTMGQVSIRVDSSADWACILQLHLKMEWK